MQKIKVAHVITRLIIGGAQENTLFTVELLSERENMEVTLISGPQTGPEGSILETVKKQEKKYNLLFIQELVREINPVKDLIALFKLYRLFRREKYDIVHTHSSKAGVIGRLAAFLAGLKVIVHTIHGLPFHPYQQRLINLLYIFLEKISGLVTHKIITVCDAMTAKAVAAKVAKEDKFITIYSGLELKSLLDFPKEKYQAEIRDRYNIAEGDLVVAKIARLFYLKGHDHLIRVAKEIVEKLPQVKIMLIGDGLLKEELQQKIKELGLKQNFIFTGLVTPQEIPKLLSVVDLVVHCSLREGLARVLPQALALRIPAISFDIDGAGEVIFDNKTGFLVPPKDEALLRQRILEILENEELRKKMADGGPKVVDPIFRKEYMVAEIEKLYNAFLRNFK
ncbi:glycosyltransferase family 4 protein [Candidatus Auribacterota bacterium]